MISTNEPFNSVISITPPMASRWLEGNIHNRPVNDGHVERLAREMKAGRWKLTHQGIAFSSSGRLLDGQHRLWAIVMSGATVMVRVFFNESPESVELLDGGLVRTASDRIRLGDRFGHNVGSKHLAVLRCMVRSFHPKQRLSYGEEVELLSRHLNAIQFAMDNLTSERKGLTTCVVRAVVARAYYSIDHQKLTDFCTILRTGMAGSYADEPIIILRDFLVQDERSFASLAVNREQYGKIERALKAYLMGEKITRLHATTLEYFPLPKDQKH